MRGRALNSVQPSQIICMIPSDLSQVCTEFVLHVHIFLKTCIYGWWWRIICENPAEITWFNALINLTSKSNKRYAVKTRCQRQQYDTSGNLRQQSESIICSSEHIKMDSTVELLEPLFQWLWLDMLQLWKCVLRSGGRFNVIKFRYTGTDAVYIS